MRIKFKDFTGLIESFFRNDATTPRTYQLPDKDITVAGVDDVAVVQLDIDTHEANTSNPHSVTKSQVGLSNADNTSDANKPVSSATQTALDAKQDTLISATNIKTINGSSVLGSGDLSITTAQDGYRLITGTDSVTSSDYYKTIVCSGTSSDYTVTLPTASGISGKWFDFVGATALTKIVTIDANSTETINGLLTRAFTGRGGFRIVSDGTNWQVTEERPSWILYTSTLTGFSGTPTQEFKYSLVGKQMIISYNIAASAASGTGLTFSLPSGYTINSSVYNYARVMSNSNYLNTGISEAGAGNTTVTLYTTAAGAAFSSAGNKAAHGIVIVDIQ